MLGKVFSAVSAKIAAIMSLPPDSILIASLSADDCNLAFDAFCFNIIAELCVNGEVICLTLLFTSLIDSETVGPIPSANISIIHSFTIDFSCCLVTPISTDSIPKCCTID